MKRKERESVMYTLFSREKSDGSPAPHRTYTGVTNSIPIRLDQHNGVVKGGAASTRGRKWMLMCFLSGMEERRAALQFEHRMKHPKWKRSTSKNVVVRKLHDLQSMLHMEKVQDTSPLTRKLPLKIYWNPKFRTVLESEKNTGDWPPTVKHVDIVLR